LSSCPNAKLAEFEEELPFRPVANLSNVLEEAFSPAFILRNDLKRFASEDIGLIAMFPNLYHHEMLEFSSTNEILFKNNRATL